MDTSLANSTNETISTHPFDALVGQSIITPKKYSLMTIDRAYLYQIPANTSTAK